MHDDMTGMKNGRIVYWGILNYYDYLLEHAPVPVSFLNVWLEMKLWQEISTSNCAVADCTINSHLRLQYSHFMLPIYMPF